MSVTSVPAGNAAVQVVPQLMPAGVLVTVPPPVPERVTVRLKETGLAVNVAVTDALAFMVIAQGPVPVQAPVQPAKVELEPAVAASVTWVPGANEDAHALPQLIPAGVLVTVPVPVPASATVSV